MQSLNTAPCAAHRHVFGLGVTRRHVHLPTTQPDSSVNRAPLIRSELQFWCQVRDRKLQITQAVIADENKLISKMITQRRDARGLINVIKRFRDKFNDVNVVVAFTRVSKVIKPPAVKGVGVVLSMLAELALDRVPNYSGIDLVNILNAMGRVTFVPKNGLNDKVVQELLANDAQKLQEIDAKGQSVVVLSLGNMKHYSPEVFSKVADAVLTGTGSFTGQHMVNVVKGYAAVNIQNDKLFHAVADKLTGTHQPQVLANAMTAFLLTGYHSAAVDQLFSTASQRLRSHMGALTITAIRNLNNALKERGYQDAEFVAAVAAEFEARAAAAKQANEAKQETAAALAEKKAGTQAKRAESRRAAANAKKEAAAAAAEAAEQAAPAAGAADSAAPSAA